MPAVFVLIWSTGFVVARFGMPHAPPLTFLSLRYALSIACFLLGVAWSRPTWPRDRELVGALAWSVLALTLGGSSLLYLLIQRGAATQVASLMYLVPPCTAVLAWWLFGEVFTWWMAVGLALTAWGVWLVVRGGVRS
jgi:drug/metabolite transporter (DMT)-like permease